MRWGLALLTAGLILGCGGGDTVAPAPPDGVEVRYDLLEMLPAAAVELEVARVDESLADPVVERGDRLLPIRDVGKVLDEPEHRGE